MLLEEEKKILKNLLSKELIEVSENIRELKKTTEPVSPDNAIGRLSRMDALEMQSVNNVKLARQQHREIQLTKALARLQTDEEFGICQECDRPINLERLKIQPESQYCVACLESLK